MTGERIPELERVGQTSRTSIGGNQKGKRGKDMKTFRKVLASALAAAMVVTAFPVANAEAASTAKLSATKATLYVGQSKTLKVTTPKTWKSVKVKATSSKKSVASVKKSGKKVTVKAVKAGTAKVTVKVTAKKAGKSVKKTLTFKATVKNPSLTLKAADVVAVGTTEQITATVKPANTKVTYTSDKTDIATVDEKGLVTGVKAGEVTITAKAGKTTKTVKMTVKDVILKDVKQTTTTKLVATIAGNTANVKASDIVITNTNSKATYAVKSVSVDKSDKTQVTIETYVAMADGKDYTVALADVTKTFTATDGKITKAAISPASVVVPTPANNSDGSNANDIVVKFTDASGVEIASVKPLEGTTKVPTGFTYVEFKVDATNNGYLSGNTLNLYKVGNVAKVTVIAHTGKYNASAVEEGNVTAEATITGVDPTAITTSAWNVKLGKKTDNASEFKNIKETKLAVKDTDVYAYIQRATSDGKTANAKDYTFESSNNDVMTVSTAVTNVKDTTAVAVTPYKSGTAYIIVKDAKKNVVTTLAVTIGDERKVTALSLDKNSFVLSAAPSVGDDSVTVKATAKDQYGEEVPITSGLTCKNANSNATSAETQITPSANKVEVKNPGLKDGKDSSNTYIVEYKDVKVTFTIVVKAYDTNATTPAAFDLVLGADKADAIVKADATDNTTISADVIGYDKNGVKVQKVAASNATWKLEKDGKAAKDAKGVTTGSALSTINVNNISTGAQMASGIYTLTVSYEGKKFVKTFEVKNTQPAVSVERIATEGAKVANCFKFTYEGTEQKDVKFYGLDGTTDVTNASGNVYVSKADVTVSVGNNKVVLTVNIGLTVNAK